MIKKLLSSTVMAVSLFGLAAPASAALTNWYVDPDGAGAGPKFLVPDFLELQGSAFIKNTFAMAPAPGVAFTFSEVAQFLASNAGTFPTNTPIPPGFSAKLTATGSGTVGGPLSFDAGGVLNIFSGATFAGPTIASFSILAGSALLQTGGVLPNGSVEVILKASSMTAGYFFDDNMVDIASYVASPNGLVLGFATNQANPIVLNPSIVPVGAQGLLNDFTSAFGGPALTGGTAGAAFNQVDTLYISNPGQFRMAVPEPSMLSLLGLAFLGLGVVARRRKSA